MSHVETINLAILSLEAMELAAKEFGGTLIREKKTYSWYGRSVGDYPLPDGMKAADLGKCSHAIKVAGINYEIGLVQKRDGKGYTLAYDFYGHKGTEHDGHKLKETFGEKLGKLAQSYAYHAAALAARAKGWQVQRKNLPNGKIQCVVTGIK